MRAAICVFALVGASLAFGASDTPHALSAEQVEKLAAGLEEAKARMGGEQAAYIDLAISRLRQAVRDGVDVGGARDPAAEYAAFKGSPAYGFLDAEERRLLGKLVAMARDPRSAHGEGDDEELERLAQKYEFCSSQVERRPWHLTPPCDLKPGDLVFRRENAFLSRHFVEASSREKRFSHVGVVSDSGDAAKVITVGDGGLSMAGVCAVGWREFMRGAVDCAVYRYGGGEEYGTRIAQSAERRTGRPFDPAFDIGTRDRLYCSELVRDAVNEAVGRAVVGTTRRGSFEYVAIDDCYRSGWIKIFDANVTEPQRRQTNEKGRYRR